MQKVANSLSSIWKPILFIIAIVLILILLAAWIAAIVGAFVSPPLVQHFFPEHTQLASIGFISLMFVVGIPLLTTALGFFRLIFGTRLSPAWRASLAVFWVLNIGFVFFLASAGVAQFSEKATAEHRLTLDEFGSDTIQIEVIDNSSSRKPVFGWLDHNDDVILPPVDAGVNIRKSENEEFYIVQESSSLGGSYQEASQLVDNIDLPYEIVGNAIKIKNWLPVHHGNKWRNQRTRLTIYVPEGKYIHSHPWPRNNSVMINASYEDRKATFWGFRKENKLWQMKADGLACLDCFQEEEKEEQEGDIDSKEAKEKAEKLSLVEE